MTPLARLRRPPHAGAPGWLAARLERAERMIDVAWGVAALWGVVRGVAAIWLFRISAADEWSWVVDPVLILALAYGLYRRSRACAVLLLGYVVVELWRAYHVQERPAGIGTAIILGISFLIGIRGTFAYRRELDAARAAS